MRNGTKIAESKEIVQNIHEIVNQLKLADSQADDDLSEVVADVFMTIAKHSQNDPFVRIAAISGIYEIEDISR